MALITDPDDLSSTEVTIATGTRLITLNEAGNLSSDGVDMQAIYSYLKEEWKSDPTLIPHPFPMVAIDADAGKYELGTDGANYNGWRFSNAASRKLVRNAGWREYHSDGTLLLEMAGIKTLGTFEDVDNDNAYYQQGNDPTDTGAAVDFTYAGPVNEAIDVYDLVTDKDTSTGFDFTDGGGSDDSIDRNDGGSWITDGYQVGGEVTVIDATTSANDGTYTITSVSASSLGIPTGSITADTGDQTSRFAKNYRAGLNLFLRVRDADTYGKTFSQANLGDAGVSALSNRLFAFPLSNATDLKIEETDANIGSNSPYTEIVVRYFDQAFSREVDSATARDFGIVIDVGTHSGVDGSSASSVTFTTAEGGMGVNAYQGGTLTIHEGTDKGVHSIASNTATTFTLSVALTASESNLSFTAQRATPVVATAEEIYEKIQYLLRQEADIDSTDQTVTGATADALLEFVGSDLNAGTAVPSNPNYPAGTGVIIEGFDSNDTNRLSFVDNTGTPRTYPYVAAGTITFNANLVNDTGPAEYFMFFEYTTRTTVTDLAISGASGSTASIDSAGGGFPSLSQNDYVALWGFSNPENNGVWQVTDASPSSTQFDATKVDGQNVIDEGAASRSLDQNPINSPDAILVDNNAGSDITGTIGAASVGFDFDYDGNVQGGRSSGEDADIVLRAIGLDLAQFVQTTGTITRATGITFSLVASLERNYENV
jgi:hypothetical protein